jgi:hypothetical protein
MAEYQNEVYEEEDEEYEMKQEMLMRETKLRFPEVEDWVISMAVKAYLNLETLGSDYDPNPEEGERIKKTYFDGLEYKTEFTD